MTKTESVEAIPTVTSQAQKLYVKIRNGMVECMVRRSPTQVDGHCLLVGEMKPLTMEAWQVLNEHFADVPKMAKWYNGAFYLELFGKRRLRS